MALGYVQLEIEYYSDPVTGRPIANGFVYIGEPDLDPEIEANRITVTLIESDGTQVPILPAGQPLTLGPGGRIIYNGSPVQAVVDQNYSQKVTNSTGDQVYYLNNLSNAVTALEVSYDNTTSGLAADNVQGAIDEVVDIIWLQYPTIAAVDADTLLLAGQYVKTAEYLTDNGGGNSYVVGTFGTADDGSIIDLTASGLQLKALFTEKKVSVREFGAKLDDVADDLIPFQAAIDYIKSIGGGEVQIDDACRISAALVTGSGVYIRGYGKHCRISTTSATANVIEMGDLVAAQINMGFYNFSVFSTVNKTAGAAFKGFRTARCVWENIKIGPQEDVSANGNLLYNGIDLDEFDFCRISGGGIITSNEGIACNGDPVNLFGAGLWMGDGLKITGQETSAGVHVGGASGGIYFADMVSATNLHNVIISTDRQPGVNNREIFFGATCALDAAESVGVQIKADSVTHLDMTGTWVASAGQVNQLSAGITIASPNIIVAKFAGIRLFNNAGGGIIANAGNILLDSCAIWDNGSGTDVTVANGFGSGVWALADVAHITVSNSYIFSNGYSVESAGYGVKIDAGVTNYIVTDNRTGGNEQGQIFEANPTSVTSVVNNNVGYVTETKGIATVLSGNTTVIVNHELVDEPDNVLLSPRDSNQGTAYYDEARNATTFTINLGDVATFDRQFYWSASRGKRQ